VLLGEIEGEAAPMGSGHLLKVADPGPNVSETGRFLTIDYGCPSAASFLSKMYSNFKPQYISSLPVHVRHCAPDLEKHGRALCLLR
jgi:hypothetical protein